MLYMAFGLNIVFKLQVTTYCISSSNCYFYGIRAFFFHFVLESHNGNGLLGFRPTNFTRSFGGTQEEGAQIHSSLNMHFTKCFPYLFYE